MYQLAAPAFAEIEIKKSRFLGQLYPLHTRAEARARLTEIRAQHPGAVHVCWALICAGDSGLDDDGEPSGTAAKPMYNVLVHKDVTNVLAVVVRYWGGTKLGAGGLTRAYGQAISDAFKTASLIAVETMADIMFRIAFADESQVRRLIEKYQAQVIAVSYTESAQMQLSMKEKQLSPFLDELSELLKGRVEILS
ncbi:MULTISPECIES: IMPACT family protein [unclassified Undibacterium]|uniref:IMPACT family protein n=1 Tax=unclassified Undibacterium TaxID=2630295 RepID=UPI003C30D107